jgi:hypothetical protein
MPEFSLRKPESGRIRITEAAVFHLPPGSFFFVDLF